MGSHIFSHIHSSCCLATSHPFHPIPSKAPNSNASRVLCCLILSGSPILESNLSNQRLTCHTPRRAEFKLTILSRLIPIASAGKPGQPSLRRTAHRYLAPVPNPSIIRSTTLSDIQTSSRLVAYSAPTYAYHSTPSLVNPSLILLND